MKGLYTKMRKTKSGPAPATVDAYLAAVPEPARTTLKKVRVQIRAAVPGETTEIISYGMPAFKYKGLLIWFAAFSDHCSLFPTASAIAAFKKELKGFKTSKGTIQFPSNKPFPAALLNKIVRFRVAQNELKKKR
jgi:uncharacterized protein YdhG (YjbR/CyaY superfamily)